MMTIGNMRENGVRANMVEQTSGGLTDDNNGIANVDIDRTKSYRCR